VTATDEWPAAYPPAPPADVQAAGPPRDLQAEQQCLGSMMWSGEAVDAAAEVVAPADFYRPAHGELFMCLVSLRAQGVGEADPVLLWNYLQAENLAGCIGGDRMYLHHLYDGVAGWTEVGKHARTIRDRAVRRRMDETGTRLQQLARSYWEDPLGAVGAAAAMVDALGGPAMDMADQLAAGPVGVTAFTTTHRETRPPVIPGLLHRMDRVVMVAGGGSGKTTLNLQVATAVAAGLHPFTLQPIPPQRVLFIDYENPRDLLQARLLQLADLAQYAPGWDPARLQVWSDPGGLDVSQPADAFRLARMIRKTRPDLVVAGPVYKMIDDDSDRSQHTRLIRLWDQLRLRHGFAVWLETHPPADQPGRRIWRPAGTNRWTQWPEFGLALLPGGKDEPLGALKLGRFRGDRAEGRLWPEVLHRNLGGGWPWVGRYPQGTLFDAPPEDGS
jgi:AAA domain/DnaB-like helicase N terminal domain